MKKSSFEYVMSMGEELGNYVDKWIAVKGDKIVAVGDDIKEVFRKAKETSPEEELEETSHLLMVPLCQA